MTTQWLDDELDRQPRWGVQTVEDPEHTGRCAYTVGLVDSLCPELHLRASPTDGDATDADWALSTRDCAAVLDELARDLVAGRITIGSRVTKTYDGGLTRVSFTIGPPVDPDQVGAHDVAPGALVLPVSWTLARRPILPAPPATETVGDGASAELLGLLRAERLDSDPPFGLRTPQVLARAAQLWVCLDLGAFIAELTPFAIQERLTWQTAQARSVAGGVGRVEQVDRAEVAARCLVAMVADRYPGVFVEAGRRVLADFDRLPATERAAVLDNLATGLRRATAAALAVEVVADVCSEQLRLGARGPWLTAAHPERVFPGPEWAAAPAIRSEVRALLGPLTQQTWIAVVRAYYAARCRAAGATAFTVVCQRLAVDFRSSACAMPWEDLQDLPAARGFGRALPVGGRARFTEWASALTALLVHRVRYSTEEAECFLAPFDSMVPGLRETGHRLR